VTILTACLALFALASAVVAVMAMEKADRVAQEQARATQDLGVTATKQLAASMAPIVADVGQDLLEEAGTDRLQWVVVEQDVSARNITLPCRNVGPGPAVIMAAAIVPTEYDASTHTENAVFEDGAPAELSLGVIPPGETVLIKAIMPPVDPEVAPVSKALGFGFCAMVRYTDVAGEQRRTSTIYVAPLPHNPNRYIETAVRVHECDSSWNLIRTIMEARRAFFVPTAGDRLGTLFDDASVRLSELTDKTTAAFDRIDAIIAERNQKLRAFLNEYNQRPHFVDTGRLRREAAEAAGETAHATASDSDNAGDSSLEREGDV
jgi:hypothetical protein